MKKKNKTSRCKTNRISQQSKETPSRISKAERIQKEKIK